MDEELKRKFQDYQKMNGSRLEDVALTFSLEGINRDLKGFIQKKISFNIRVMEHFSNMLGGLATGDKNVVKDILKDKGSPINTMIDHLLSEAKVVNHILNTTIFGLLNRENLLSSSNIADDGEEMTEDKEIDTKNTADSDIEKTGGKDQ